MKLNPKTCLQRRGEKLQKWHNWFAWYPVWLDKYPDKNDDEPAEFNQYAKHGIHRIKSERVWLEFVQRRAYFWVAVDYVTCCTWHYKKQVEVNKMTVELRLTTQQELDLIRQDLKNKYSLLPHEKDYIIRRPKKIGTTKNK